MTDDGIRLLAAAVAVLPLLGVALGLGKIFSEWISSVARNPGAGETIQPVGLGSRPALTPRRPAPVTALPSRRLAAI